MSSLDDRVRSFIDEVERALRDQESRGQGGMRVPYMGDFAGANPSVLGRLRWWVEHLRGGLAQAEPSDAAEGLAAITQDADPDRHIDETRLGTRLRRKGGGR